MLRQRPVWPLLHRAICWRTDATSIGLSFEAQYKLRNPEFTTPSRVLITIQSPSIYASSPPNFDPSSIRWGHSFGQALKSTSDPENKAQPSHSHEWCQTADKRQPTITQIRAGSISGHLYIPVPQLLASLLQREPMAGAVQKKE